MEKDLCLRCNPPQPDSDRMSIGSLENLEGISIGSQENLERMSITSQDLSIMNEVDPLSQGRAPSVLSTESECKIIKLYFKN